METIRVNMTPNPSDIQTIHCSQGDTEAREWEFELHNNGEVIDAGGITEQMVFKSYKGGTEQILPENGAVPVTAPFVGDIKYPDATRTDQEFLYRQSPAEEDGNAKITDIKGNTLVWNQFVRNGNFVDTSYWNGNGTKIVSNNEMTYTKPARWNSLSNGQLINLVSGHKYLVMFEAYCENDTMLIFWQTGTGTGGAVYTIPAGTSWKKHSLIVTSVQTTASGRVPGFDNNSAQETIFHLRNYMFIDLTMMGLDALTLDEVKEWLNAYYPLSYYDYNTGTLLSFNGTGLKTVGKNQFNSEHAISATNVVESNDNGTITIKDVSSLTWSNAYIGYSDVIAGKEYTFKASLKYGRIGGNSSGTSRPVSANQPDTNIGDLIFAAVTSAIPSRTFIPNFTGRIYWWYCTDINNANHQQFTMQPMLSTTNADFEPYTSSTASLPISTYFPTGMKSVPSAYDELTPSKAVTRVGSVDLGTLTYVREAPATIHPDWPLFYASVPNALGRYGTNGNTQICAKYSNRSSSIWQDKTIGFGANSTNINIADTTFTDYTVDQVKQALSGVMLCYRLATPTETSFTTASLVTENGEVALANENGVLVGKCNSDVSADAGFIEGKIKLSDEDGDVYSNKIQIHVERSPQ